MRLLFLILLLTTAVEGTVRLGVDNLFDTHYVKLMKGKRVGLITNHTGVTSDRLSTIDAFKGHRVKLVALFGPEHGITGSEHASAKINHQKDADGIPIYSLYGETRRPTDEMLEGIDLLVFDVQDIGTRCYTFASTLFYVMEEAAARNIPVVVLDRPNPINGVIVDGPMLDEKWRSFVGYINVPFCHGMTIGELARFFNAEYKVGCELVVVPMTGWERAMTYRDTGLPWVPTSPQIPEADTPLYYPATVILGEAQTDVQIGVGYTLPFKVIGAPWIDGNQLAKELNRHHFAGVHFSPYEFRPFFGRHKGEMCYGVRIEVTDPTTFKPVSTQFLVMGSLKTLYPKEFEAGYRQWQDYFYKVCGGESVWKAMHDKKYIAWKLIEIDEKARKKFLKKRQRYLLY